MKNMSRTLFIASIATLAACSDNPVAPSQRAVRPAADLEHSSRSYMANYVSIGTSLSMGWMSDGVVASSQNLAWPKLLADHMGAEFTVPGIDEPGCPPPLAAPLGSFRRVDGTPFTRSTVCAPNVAGVTLPTHNLAIENATTAEALNATPATASQGRGPVTSRVLPAGLTQVTAMQSLHPTFVSVELGGNELLPAQAGLLYPGVTFTPFPVFQANYQRVIDAVRSTGAKAVLVSIRTDLRNFPTIRTGPEIASQRAAFAAYNVTVNANCDESANFIFVRGVIPTAIITGVTRAGYGLPPYDLSCADRPGTPDFIITPGDMTFINALGDQMSAEIERQAEENGYAVFALGELFNESKKHVPFDLNEYLTSDTPYGRLISLDGVHPSADGQKLLAKVAHVAIVQRYANEH